MPLGQYTRMFSQKVRKTLQCFVAHDVEKKFNTLYNITKYWYCIKGIFYSRCILAPLALIESVG